MGTSMVTSALYVLRLSVLLLVLAVVRHDGARRLVTGSAIQFSRCVVLCAGRTWCFPVDGNSIFYIEGTPQGFWADKHCLLIVNL